MGKLKQKSKRHKKISKVLLKYGLIVIVSIVAIYMFISATLNISDCTNKIVENSLKDQIKQNNNFIKIYLQGKIDVLQNVVASIRSEELDNKHKLTKRINKLASMYEFSKAYFIDSNGYMYLDDGTVEDVRDKSFYYKVVYDKKPLISNAFNDEKVDYQAIAITVPVFINGEIVGDIYAIKNVYDLKSSMKNYLGDDVGFSYIMDEDGYIIFRVSNKFDDSDCRNFYHYMMYQDIKLGNYINEVKDEIEKNQSDVLKVEKEDKTGYLGYAPVLSNSNWITVSYIEDNKVLEYGKNLLNKTIQIMTCITIAIITIACYILGIEINKGMQLKKVVFTDELTGISNLLAFHEALKKILKNTDEKYVVAVFDIKKFKFINYKYGYNYGDKIIKKLAKALDKKYFGKEKCSRIESDTFIALIKNNGNVQQELNDFLVQVLPKSMGVSGFRIGLYEIKNNKEEITDIIEKAKLAWQYIKNDTKKNYNYYDDNLLKQIMDEEQIESKMEKALEDGEFKVYLQPKVNLENDKICGAEALVRWISKDLGFMPPGKFIPIFEKDGFVSKVDFYMLEQVFVIMERLIKEGRTDITISVNQSRETINQIDYIDKLKAVVKKYNVDTKYIELEITESVFTDDNSKIINIVKEIQKLGFKVSMDDFGSGYSSLNLLKEVPINILKIDRVFLDDDTHDTSKSEIIIKRVIEMARDLNINVICEGVESDKQVYFLKAAKCEMAQGYYYSKPVPVQNFEAMIFNKEKE